MNNKLQPTQLYSLALNSATSLIKDKQLDYTKLYLPKKILNDICFKDLLDRAIDKIDTEVTNHSQQIYCAIVPKKVFDRGPAAISDKYHFPMHNITTGEEYIIINTANMRLYLFVSQLYKYANCKTIEEDIRKEVSVAFINAYNNIDMPPKDYFYIPYNLSETLEGLQMISAKDMGLIHPKLYLLCIKNLIKLIVNKDKLIFNPDEPLLFHSKCKTLLQNNELTVETFIDLCYQSQMKTELLKINQKLNRYF